MFIIIFNCDVFRTEELNIQHEIDCQLFPHLPFKYTLSFNENQDAQSSGQGFISIDHFYSLSHKFLCLSLWLSGEKQSVLFLYWTLGPVVYLLQLSDCVSQSNQPLLKDKHPVLYCRFLANHSRLRFISALTLSWKYLWNRVACVVKLTSTRKS